MPIRDFCGAIEEAANRAPSAIAIDDAGATMTYGELLDRARAVAAALAVRGAKPGTPVGILLPQGTAYVTSFLGCAWSGAVPMPLDVAAPPARQQQVLAKAQCEIVIDDAFLASVKPAAFERHVPRAEDPSYIVFTSGSTGTPKAILGSQRGLSHFLRWESGELALDANVRVSALAPPPFDVSLRDMLVPLCNGGTLCIPSPDVRTAPRRLLEWLATTRVSLMHIVPTLFRLLLAELEAGAARPESLRHVLLAGEPLYAGDVARWRAVMGNSAELLNLYGPSETTLAKVFHRIQDDPDAEPGRVVPIGLPMPNTAVLILDNGRLCDIGEIGEIHIKTPYRSLGYLNDPELTAAAFIDNPLEPGQNDVLYRTGDLGRYLSGRVVECLGRVDHQVKINGIRIEPAEIEAAVRRAGGIATTVVIGHRTAARQWTLACYYVREEGSEATAGSIRAHLERELPPAWIPSFFIELDELPTTISGKVNRRALPKPEELLYEQRPYRAPQSQTEERLAAIWGEILGLRNVGVEHAFIELGGDSLKAIRATSAIYRTFELDVTLEQFFERRTIRALAALIDDASRTAIEPIPLVAEAPGYEASHAQLRLWTLHQMEIDAVAYNIPMAFRIDGPLDPERLRRAFNAIIARHESLRTTFVAEDGVLRQVISKGCELELPVLPFDEARIEHDRTAGFDLERGPLLRATLMRIEDDAHVLLLNFHHIICDVWSLDVFVRELRALYADPAADLPPLSLQYRDFAAWQNARRASGALDVHRDYWLAQLAGEIPRLDLPADAPRPAVQTFRGATHRLALDAATTEELLRLSASLDASLFVVVQAIVKTLLHRWTSQRDIIVGAPVLGRDHPALEEQVGLYVNTLALRDEVDPALGFGDLVARVRQTTHNATTHQAYPFDVLVDELALERDMSRSPLFDVMVVVQENDPEPFVLPGLDIAPFGRENAWNFSRFDLVFHVAVEHGELVLDLNYNTDLFSAARAARFASHFETAIHSAIAAPQRAVGALEIIPPSERDAIERFSRSPRPARDGETIVDRFARQAARTPERHAIEDGACVVTYAELDRRSNALASLLAAQISRGDRVAMMLRRSADAIVAMLGIMKAGAVYLPVDPDLPRARIDFILQDSGARVVVTEQTMREAAGAPDEAPRVALTPRDVAYMIYTSGSTGTPKGVLVEHGGFVNMSLCQIDTFGITPADRVLGFASLSFDASLAEIFSALFSGATLVIASREIVEHPAAFLELLDVRRVSVATLPPVYLAALGRPAMSSLRVLITAGEAARVDDARAYAASRACFNAYGPTETSVCATMHRVDPRDTGMTVPIGRPVDGTRVCVLDHELRAVPLGVAGEICVAGAGLARGYHGNDAATRERFVIHDGERFYRTGDRARWRADGALEFLGRRDDQVKLAGHRVELGAIESALHECGAGDVFIAMRDDDLTAWYTPPRRVELWPSVAEFLIYDDVLYGAMAGDVERNRLYRAAFESHLRGRTVVEIGPGAELVLSRMALDAGARHVYAIEIMAETYERARARIASLGLGDRITLIHGDALTVELPEPADYCISEIVGGIGGSEGAARLINAARRFLRDGANMLPRRSVTRIAAASLTDIRYAFSEIAAHYVRRIFDDAGSPFDLRICTRNVTTEHLLSAPGTFEDLDFTRDVPLESAHDVRLAIAKPGALTGLLVWLNLHVDDGAGALDILRNQASWLPVYLPLFDDAIAVEPGDVLDLTIERTLCDDGLHPDYRLRGALVRRDGAPVPIACETLHHPASHRATPFYERLFANGIAIERTLDPDELRARLVERLPRHEVPRHLVQMPALPLNANGKVDRRALPDPARPQAVPDAETMTPIEEQIAAAWQEILGVRPSLGDNFFSLGGDSIKAIRIAGLLHRRRLRLEVSDLFQHPTVRGCAAAVAHAIGDFDQSDVAGELPPTPIQRWFLEHFAATAHHFNQSIVLRSRERLDGEAVRSALTAVQRHHDALRTRISLRAGTARIAAPGEASLEEMTASSEEAWHARAAEIHAAFDLDAGPLMRALLVHLPSGDALWLVCHHLVVDAVSWNFIVEDFEAAYRAAVERRAADLPLKTHSYQAFATALVARANSDEIESERPYWQAVAAEALEPLAAGPPEAAAYETAEIAISAEATARLLDGARRSHDCNGAEVLLTALAIALRNWRRVERCLVGVETHGRTPSIAGLDVSRTVGWFTSFFPFVLDLPRDGDDPGECLRHVRERLRAVPSGGTGYGLLTRLATQPLPDPRPEVGFNYLGELSSTRTGSAFAIDWNAPGPPVSPLAEPVHTLHVLGAVLDGSLAVTFDYDPRMLSASDVRALAAELRRALEQLIEHCGTAGAFTVTGLSVDQLDDIFSGLE